jgi:hypothetical protein
MKVWALFGAVLCMVASLPGCSNEDEWTRQQPATVVADGVVTLDGKPVDGASIILSPIEPSQHAASALTDSNGRFSLAAFPNKPGAVPGNYKVRVAKTIEVAAEPIKVDLGEDAAHAATDEPGESVTWKNVLPEKYSNPETSEIFVEVPADGVSDLKIELTTN